MMDGSKQKYGLSILLHCGGGAYGDVYLCQDASGRQVALKVVSKAKVGSGWERELKGISHYRKLAEGLPHLLRLYHVGEDEETLYYTMELADAIPGQAQYKPDTLAARLEQGHLPQKQLIPTLSSVLNAIRTLHEAGLAHRDIKPENILFVKGELKLADLGLLSPLSGTMTRLAGTLDFLPPEERTGESIQDCRESRQRNDLYAFGKLIYCCVTGKGANEFPSTPPDMPLTLYNKHFFRLAMRLCDREPTRRLNQLSKLLTEFQRTVRLCMYGEGILDQFHYVFSATARNLRSVAMRFTQHCRRHWMWSALGASLIVTGSVWLGKYLILGVVAVSSSLPLIVTGSVWLGKYIASRPDKASEELAQTLQEQREIAAKTDFNQADYTFYQGRYSVAVPTDWQVFDQEAIAKARLPGDVLAQRLQGVLLPKEANGNVSTVVSLMILPQTAEQLSALNDQDKIKVLKPLFADDVEAISIHQYRNPRLNLDTILFVGEAQPSTAVVCYLYPQHDHTLCLNALIPQENYETDMGKFLAITDSLVWRIRK